MIQKGLKIVKEYKVAIITGCVAIVLTAGISALLFLPSEKETPAIEMPGEEEDKEAVHTLTRRLIEGDYVGKMIDDGKQKGEQWVAQISMVKEKEYTLSLISSLGIKDFTVHIDRENGTAFSPDFGFGSIVNEEGRSIRIVFTSENNQSWEFIKRLN